MPATPQPLLPRRARLATLVGAVLLALAAVLSPLPAAAVPPALTNGDFSEVGADGVPVGWGTWRPAGTATVTVDPDGGPSGGPAVSLTSTSGSTARIALTQRVPVDGQTARLLTLRGQVRGDGLTGGFSMVRVQGYDASGAVVLPVARGPYLTGTFDWRPFETTVELPATTARLSVEPMLDRSAGSISFADLTLGPADGRPRLEAGVTGAGVTELRWSFGEEAGEQVVGYRVHRAEGTQAPEPTEATVLRPAAAQTTADDTVRPGATYTYLVTARDAAGATVASTRPVTVTAPASFTSQQQIATLAAIDTGGTAHVAWSLPAGTPTAGLVLVHGGRSEPLSGDSGTVDVPAAPGDALRLERDGELLATASVGRDEHPRAVVDEAALQELRNHLRAGEPTVTGAWEALLGRLGGDGSAYPTNGSAGLYRARDAAFAFAVTGDEAWAQDAYRSAMAAEGFIVDRDTNLGLELGRAALLLAPVYDWSYAGLQEEQRAGLRDLVRRTADLFSTYHHDTLDGADKASNWVGVARTTELAMLLAARGDGDLGMYDERIGYLVDQVAQHLDAGYGDSGHTQEGWDYLHYTGLYMLPSAYLAQDAGIEVLDAHLTRPQWWNLALHVASSRPDGDVAQFGVAGPSGQVDGLFPLLFPITPDGALPGLKHLYDEVQGVDSQRRSFDGVHSLWAALYYPTTASGDPDDVTLPEARRALLDDEPGFYAFRNRLADADDTLVVTSNRNSRHKGWSAAETFSLSWMSHGTTWAGQGGKSWTSPQLWSKPLVDGQLEAYANQYETVRGEGRTVVSRAFEGQGGGYLELDGSANFGVQRALRKQVVDLAEGDASDAVVAIHDSFADDTEHRWDWQLRPETGVTIDVPDAAADGHPSFTLTDAAGTVLSGFVLGEGVEVTAQDGTLRLSRSGRTADFRVVLATSTEGPLRSRPGPDGTLVVDGRVVDLDRLDTAAPFPDEVPADGASSAPGRGVLSTDEGHDTGLRDGFFSLTADLWWGENASLVRLYENGEPLAVRRLTPSTPQAQRVVVEVAGRPDGRYTYTGELVNSRGSTPLAPVTVEVSDAAPGRPVLSHDDFDGDGSFRLTADLWWGTNATSYRFLEDGVEIGSGTLAADTPHAQRASVAVEDAEPGHHRYVVELANHAGTTRSELLEVEVRGPRR
ncbi:hypothetical protein DT076_16255 [Desertihabitans brevis]|uniref:Fibronectin type-III domain-containing protein n=1 Tax=Desertihabitans brevis TaxID=2268447 RepID=A0A367YTW2_9ACTN|nr:hypothetical protein [Desertihabitans brevis]RCK68462.1 hypothetical protein DT076_16255 [Desertihabitans brevis]